MKNIINIAYLLIMISSLSHANETYILQNNINDTIKLATEINKPVLIIFSADWCKHCTILKDDFTNNKLTEISNYVICIVDVDTNKEIKKEFGIKSLPTSIILSNNVEKSRKIGYSNKEYKGWLTAQK